MTTKPPGNDPKGLGWDKTLNPSPYDMYAKKLPMQGWAGVKSPEEKAYVKRYKADKQSNPTNHTDG